MPTERSSCVARGRASSGAWNREDCFFTWSRGRDEPDERTIEGFSEYDRFEPMTAAESWQRYGPRVGYPTRDDYLGRGAAGTEPLGLIQLEDIRGFHRPSGCVIFGPTGFRSGPTSSTDAGSPRMR